MKNKVLILTLVIVTLLTSIGTAFANPVESKIGFLINNEIKVIPQDMGQPFLSNSRTFVPLRFVSETLGFKVEWEQASRTATIKHSKGDIKVQIGNKTVFTPSGQVVMDVEAFLKDGRTYVPVRFVAEALGFEVDWIPFKNVEGARNYPYDFYVSIDGQLGNYNATDDNGTGITNVVSNNPADWAETTNPWQYNFELAKNKPLIDYMEKNHKGNFYMAGYTTGLSDDMGPDIAYDKWGANHINYPAMAMTAYNMTKADGYGYWMIIVNWFDACKDALEKSLYAIAGQEDGQYIFDLYNKGQTQPIPTNEWLRTPSGREFQIKTKNTISGVELLVK